MSPIKEKRLRIFELKENIEIHCHELKAEIDALGSYLTSKRLREFQRRDLALKRSSLIKHFYKGLGRIKQISEIMRGGNV